MTLKDSHSISFSGTFKPQSYKVKYKLYCHMFLFCFYLSIIINGKAFNAIFFKSSTLVQIV